MAPVFLTFIELFGLVVESAPRCANCHDTEHSTATCPHVPASFTHDAALGYLAPAAAAGLLDLLDLDGRCRLVPFLPEPEVPAVVGGGR